VLVVFECTLLWQSFGVSLGMKLLGLRLVVPGGRLPALGARALRFLSWHLSLVSVAGLFAPLWDTDRLSWHDRLSRTVSQRAEQETAAHTRWLRTSWGIALALLIASTLTAGVFLTEINLAALFTGAGNSGIVWRGLFSPDWSELGGGLSLLIETIFMALMATLFAIFVAVPLSFLAARNLMRGALAIPMGRVLAFFWALIPGFFAARYILGALGGVLHRGLGTYACFVPLGLLGLLVLALLLQMRRGERRRIGPALTVLGLLLAALTGMTLEPLLGGAFALTLAVLVTSIGLTIPIHGAMAGHLASRSESGYRLVMGALGTVPGAAVGAIVGGIISLILWAVVGSGFSLLWPAACLVLGGVGGFLFVRQKKWNDSLPIGMAVYTILRVVLSIIRSIEPIIWAIVFVVIVTPRRAAFAGVLALFVHSIADLTKLYSERLESIDSGPVEAVTATGAGRLQVILYGIVPQIVNPYISFTLYRWDINVRMATIIGVVGGGGIGQMLYQYTRLWYWERASVLILLIIGTVWVMDYTSSKLRARFETGGGGAVSPELIRFSKQELNEK